MQNQASVTYTTGANFLMSFVLTNSVLSNFELSYAINNKSDKATYDATLGKFVINLNDIILAKMFLCCIEDELSISCYIF